MGGDKTSEYLSKARDDIEANAATSEEADAVLDFLDAYDDEAFHIDPPYDEGNGREDTLAKSSRLAYARALKQTVKHVDVLECTARDLNRYANQLLTGDHDAVTDDGLSQNTIHQKQVAWRKFARFHQKHPDGADLSIDPDEIVLVDREDTKVDERDMFDSEEIQAMRDACQNKRDRALLELLIYTGQRHNALRNLKVKDVKPDQGESGVLYLPDIEEGLKGADGKRPLLGAQKPCREWKRSHPTGDPEDYFITHVYDWSGRDDIEPGDQLSRDAFGGIPKRIGERAGIEKPLNPHNFRHYFVTMAIGKHGMSMDTVRHLVGHAADSRELERTYQHLVDDDHIENAELDMGIRDGREESLTPSQCIQCGEPLEPDFQSCPYCNAQYGPSEEDAKEMMDDATYESKGKADAKTEALVDAFRDAFTNNPEAFANAIDVEALPDDVLNEES